MKLLLSGSINFRQSNLVALLILSACLPTLPRQNQESFAQAPTFNLRFLPSSKRTIEYPSEQSHLPRSGFALDSEAFGRKLSVEEQLRATQKELDKRRDCEALSDRFIQRWHETLDLNLLFNEFYIGDPQLRKRNVAMFYGIYNVMVGSAGVKVEKGFTDEILQAGFFAFWNLYYLRAEAELVYPDEEERLKQIQVSPEIERAQAAFRKNRLSDKVMQVKPVQEFIKVTDLTLSYYRQKFPREGFESVTYKASLKAKDSERMEYVREKDFQIIRGFPNLEVKDNIEVYYLKRGVFEFYFIEEAGKLKVLTLGYDI